MFLIPTYLGPSPIHGFGVYSASWVGKGTKIWEMVPEVDWILERSILSSCPETFISKLADHLYLDAAGRYVLCGDNARFMNHADDPNCVDDGSRCTAAAREIFPGDELTCDYRLFDRRLDSGRPVNF